MHALHKMRNHNLRNEAPLAGTVGRKDTKKVPEKSLKEMISDWRASSAQETICFDTSGKVFIRNDSISFYTYDPFPTADGNLLISGQGISRNAPYPVFAFLMKCDFDGNVLWTRRYDSVNHSRYHYINYHKATELQDGTILLTGYINNRSAQNDDLIFTRTNPTGDIIWSKTYTSRIWGRGYGSTSVFSMNQVKQDPYTNDIFMCGSFWAAGRCLTRINVADGSIKWSNNYESYNDWDNPFGFDIRQNEVRFFGKYSDYSYFVSVYRINKGNGDTIQTKVFQSSDTSGHRVAFLGNDPLQVLENGNYVLTGKTHGSYQYPYNSASALYHASVVELDSNLNFVRAYNFRNFTESNTYNTRISMFPDGTGLFTMLKFISGYTADVYYVQFKDGQILKQRKKRYLGEGIPMETKAIKTPRRGDMVVKLLGDSITNISKIEMLELHPSDSSSFCIGVDDRETFIHPYPFITVSQPLDSIGTNLLQESMVQTITASDLSVITIPGCRQVSFCDSLELIASANTICITQSLQVTIRKNRECGSLVPIRFDTTGVQSVIMLNDSTYRLRFRTPWSGYIYGRLQGCGPILDSVFVNVLDAKGPVSLGLDTLICPGNTIRLNAGKGYAAYEWQDGSIDSVLIVTQPGTYHIKASNACGDVFSDTIIVSAHPPVPIDIGPDRVKCNQDTIQLAAPTGFLTYSWSPDYRANSLVTRSIVVNPLVDTFYSVKAEKTLGCFAFDTVRIRVHHSPRIRLGNDTSFCAGASVSMNAGPGFASYQWSNGSNSQQINVNAAGAFDVIGTTAEGCRSFDTFNVLQVFPLPQVSLDQDPELCMGSSRTLDAGSFSSYLWQDGSTGRTFTARGTGQFGVTVRDNNGCTGTGTTTINTILPLPQHFLFGDTAICSYGTIQLKPSGNYASYQWSTGGALRDITISAPGIYWLEVKDAKNCKGRDSVVVHAKQCLKGLFVPSAFTPNSDGRNDKMQALIFGEVKSYLFTVYNRWGQIVFQTADPSRGWDGKVGGIETPGAAFIWTCQYQLAGEPAKLEKGSFVLIR
jgi:gliding motility-associated-like protein